MDASYSTHIVGVAWAKEVNLTQQMAPQIYIILYGILPWQKTANLRASRLLSALALPLTKFTKLSKTYLSSESLTSKKNGGHC